MKNAQRLAFATAILTVVLIGVGVYVRATGSGLGCPDWPTCHGGAVPPGNKHSLIEFSHRFTASLVGFLVIGTAVCAWKYYRHVPFILWTATAGVPLVGIQGILGAVTVVRELPPEIVATHLLTAMLVLTCEFAVAFAMYLEDPAHRAGALAAARGPGRAVGLWALVAVAWLAALLWVGGYMAESGASTACDGWPACNGSVFPSNDHQEIIHMLHRYLAAGLAFAALPFFISALRRRHAVRWAGTAATAAAALYGAQVVVGALNVWYTFPDAMTVTHTVIASLVWSALASATILGLYVPALEPRPHRLSAGSGVPA